MQEGAESNELVEASVVDWSTRPRRQRRPPAPSYWEEYVETDTWYQKKLIEDVPEEELHAALIDEDFEDDEGEEGDEEEEDEDMSEDEGEDGEYVPDNSDEEEDESSDASECESECESDASDDSEASEEVQRPGEGE